MSHNYRAAKPNHGNGLTSQNCMKTPQCSCLSQTLAKTHLNLVIKTTHGVLGLSFKSLSWHRRHLLKACPAGLPRSILGCKAMSYLWMMRDTSFVYESLVLQQERKTRSDTSKFSLTLCIFPRTMIILILINMNDAILKYLSISVT